MKRPMTIIPTQGPLVRNPEGQPDFAYIGGEADASTHEGKITSSSLTRDRLWLGFLFVVRDDAIIGMRKMPYVANCLHALI